MARLTFVDPSLNSQGVDTFTGDSFSIQKVSDPSTGPDAALEIIPGLIDNDDYQYCIDFSMLSGNRTAPSGSSNTVTVVDNLIAGKITVSNIAQPDNSAVVSINLYRSSTASLGDFGQIATLVIGTTTYLDNIPEASVDYGTPPATSNETGNLSVSGNVDIGGNLAVVGNTTMYGDFINFGDTSLQGYIGLGDAAAPGISGGIGKYLDFATTITDLTTSGTSYNFFNSDIRLNASGNYAGTGNFYNLVTSVDAASTHTYSLLTNGISFENHGSGDIESIFTFASFFAHYGSGAISQADGFDSYAYNFGSGTIGDVTGIYTNVGTFGGAVTNAYGLRVDLPATPGSITNIYGLYLADQSGASGSSYAIYSNGAPSYHKGNFTFGGRILGSSGGTSASNNLTMPTVGNQCLINGNTQINAITTTGWIAGSRISLIFSGTPTIKHNTAGGAGTAKIFLASSVDLILIAANATLTLEYDGTQWQEVGRKIP